MNKTCVIWEEVAKRLNLFRASLHPIDINSFNQWDAFFYYMEVPRQYYDIHGERRNFGVSVQFRTSLEVEEIRNKNELTNNQDLGQVSNQPARTIRTNLHPMHCFNLLFARRDKKKHVRVSEVDARNASLSRDVNLVGLEKQALEILDCITGLPCELKILTITGEAGMGKTTLARSLYDHPLIVKHFKFRVWVTLTPEHHLKHVPSEVLSCIYNVTDIHDRPHEVICAELLGFLKDKRYLIVLDNLCQIIDLHELTTTFPVSENGSRIICTSRLRNLCMNIYSARGPLSDRVVSGGPPCIHFDRVFKLDFSESWELLSSKIFPNESSHAKLIPSGKEITQKCGGYPTVIVVIGGLLSKLQKTEAVWREVARFVGTQVDNGSGNYAKDNMLHQLKACFLNMRFLPADYRINVSRKFLYKAPQMELQQIRQEVSHIIEEVKMIRKDVLEKPGQNMEEASSNKGSKLHTNVLRSSTKKDGEFIGLGEEVEEMLSCITGEPLHLKAFAFTGMAGIGKSTFSKRLYDHPCVVEYFYVRSWVSLSQKYQLNKVLLGLLSCISNLSDDTYKWSEDELKERLYRSLKGQRYLIVLDDIWDPKAWNDLKRVFPNDHNGSRIILTSRLTDACIYDSSYIEHHQLRFLSPNESWELLCSRVFQNEPFPLELVELGVEIANKCRGLPLALVVIGGFLSQMTKTLTIWEEVAKDVSSLVMEDPEHCQNVVGLSYNNLPEALKACLLYMGNFPEDHEIHAQKLVYLWVAEGFIPPMKEKSLEEVAETCLESLVGRSLVMVKRRSSNGKIKICYIHDLVRDFCLRESRKENFLCVINSYRQEPLIDLRNQRRVAFHSGIRKYTSAEGLIAFTRSRSFFCYEALGPTDLKSCSGMYFKLLRVLDISNLHLASLPEELISLTHLRYLAITIQNFLCISDLFRLHSLQALLVCCEWDGHLPKEFWRMLELRHLYLKGCCVPLAFVDNIQSDCGVLNLLQQLRTLSTVHPVNCTKEVFMSMPNLKDLGIFETDDDYHFRGWSRNLVWLQELDTLKYVFFNPFVRPSFKERHPSWGTAFPPKLRKLTLSGTSLPWEDMIHLRVLPNLEVLKLKNYAFSGPVWKPDQDGFPCLKFLLIGSTDLERWEADFSPFPRLQHLVLRHCKFLEEIPDAIGDTPTLEKIEVHCCSETAATSARNLQEDKDWLTVYITKGPKMRRLETLADSPMWGATISGVNEASYTLRTSQYLGAEFGENGTASTSESKEIIALMEEKEETAFNSRAVSDDEENDDADDLYFHSDDLEYDY